MNYFTYKRIAWGYTIVVYIYYLISVYAICEMFHLLRLWFVKYFTSIMTLERMFYFVACGR